MPNYDPILGEFWKYVGCNAHPWSHVDSIVTKDEQIFRCVACMHAETCGECLHARLLGIETHLPVMGKKRARKTKTKRAKA